LNKYLHNDTKETELNIIKSENKGSKNNKKKKNTATTVYIQGHRKRWTEFETAIT
jgi:hypothetical protein